VEEKKMESLYSSLDSNSESKSDHKKGKHKKKKDKGESSAKSEKEHKEPWGDKKTVLGKHLTTSGNGSSHEEAASDPSSYSYSLSAQGQTLDKSVGETSSESIEGTDADSDKRSRPKRYIQS
jgi:hypothetical protein